MGCRFVKMFIRIGTYFAVIAVIAVTIAALRHNRGDGILARRDGIVTLIILKVLDIIPGLGLRVSAAEEDAGLDISMHGERAFVSDGAD